MVTLWLVTLKHLHCGPGKIVEILQFETCWIAEKRTSRVKAMKIYPSLKCFSIE